MLSFTTPKGKKKKKTLLVLLLSTKHSLLAPLSSLRPFTEKHQAASLRCWVSSPPAFFFFFFELDDRCALRT